MKLYTTDEVLNPKMPDVSLRIETMIMDDGQIKQRHIWTDIFTGDVEYEDWLFTRYANLKHSTLKESQ